MGVAFSLLIFALAAPQEPPRHVVVLKPRAN
jgi:hypothetical protein